MKQGFTKISMSARGKLSHYQSKLFPNRFYCNINDFERYFRWFNPVIPYSAGCKIVIFGYSGFEDGVRSTKSMTSLRKTSQNQNIYKYTIFDFQPRYEQVELRLRDEEKEYRSKIDAQPLPERHHIIDEENIAEEEYLHNWIQYCGINFLPIINSDKEKLCYFCETEDRFKLVPKIKNPDDSDSDDSD